MKSVFCFFLSVIVLVFLLDTAFSQKIDWYVTQTFIKKPYLPSKDSSGYEWYEYSYNDTKWSPLKNLPDRGWGCDKCDRYYRGYFELTEDNLNANDYYLDFTSDDGIWIYVNSGIVGHWGGEMHKGGRANGPGAGKYEKVDPVFVSDKLHSGKNVISVHVSECDGLEFFDMKFYVRPKRYEE